MLYFSQCFPWTGGCTQYALRSKALGGDLTRYTCFQVPTPMTVFDASSSLSIDWNPTMPTDDKLIFDT